MHRTPSDRRPGDLYGRREHDRVISALDSLAGLYFRALAHRPGRGRCLAVDTRTHTVTVVGRTLEAHDENVVVLELGGTGELPGWHPGAHIDVSLPSGRFRQYSLCGDEASPTYRIAVRLIADGSGGSREIHETVHVGDTLRIGTPRNAFPFAVGAGPFRPPQVRFVAGGIGITPILSMVATAHRLGLDWSLTYLGRTADSLAFLSDLRRYGSRVRVRLDDEHGLPTADDVLGDLCDGAEVYCCGPLPVLEMLRRYTAVRGTLGLHYERFSPPIVDGTPFRIELASDGAVLDVPADRTALDVVRAVRPELLYSCRQGICGTCRVRVLGGEPVHRGTALTSEEQRDHMLLCVSRADKDGVVIDL